jgi:hypothetical protein
MTSDDTSGRRDAAADLRWGSDLCCLWRVCANAKCRRARACRGRVHTCAKRNYGLVPQGVRDVFEALLVARWSGLPFEDFKDDIEGTEEADAYFAWRRAASADVERSS